MKKAIILSVLALAAGGCSERDDVFGRTYDECVLKNAKAASDEGRQIALDACRRKFESASTQALTSSVQISTTEFLGQQNEEFVFDVTNPSDVVVTKVHVQVGFYRSQAEADSSTSTSPAIDSWDWDLPTFIEPGGRVFLTGTFPKTDTLPSRFVTVKSIVATKEMRAK